MSAKLPLLNPETFINRELSTIAFNRRVLEQARDARVPLLERVKFLAIFSNNLDEFYMVRVSAYLEKLHAGINSSRPDGLKPHEIMAQIRAEVGLLVNEQRALMRTVLAELEKQGIIIRAVAAVPPDQRTALRSFFAEEIFPVLTPLAVDHARPFPFISNLSLNIGVLLARNGNNRKKAREDDEPLFVRIKVPDMMPRLISVGKALHRHDPAAHSADLMHTFVWMEDVIADNLDLLFPGMDVIEHFPFRLTRNADIDYEHEQEVDSHLDISALVEESLRERRFGFVVRLSVPDTISKRMLQRLIHELEVDPERDVYAIEGALGAASLFQLAAIDRPDLKDPPYVPRAVLPADTNIFDVIRQGDVLVHHPFDSFLPVEQFFQQAAHDPDVLAIKATLYRVGKNSPVVQALMDARDNDKQVAVLVELKARFDEENNLEWARALEDKGVHVTYGVEELPVKTHAKVALVVRREADGVRRYVHLGTGNYNASTARLYTDCGMLTCNREIAEDASRLFNRLTAYAPATTYRHLLVAPEYLHEALVALVDDEIAAAQAGKPARVIWKMNQLEEDVLINKLYEASRAGVQVDLIVRGLCCLVPGLPGVSENIRVRSIIGRFLEHGRIYYFENAPANRRVYMGSADIMRRNLYNRVEVVFPLLDEGLQRKALRILNTQMRDNVGAWELLPDRSYQRVPRDPDTARIESQAIFMTDSFGLDQLP